MIDWQSKATRQRRACFAVWLIEELDRIAARDDKLQRITYWIGECAERMVRADVAVNDLLDGSQAEQLARMVLKNLAELSIELQRFRDRLERPRNT